MQNANTKNKNLKQLGSLCTLLKTVLQNEQILKDVSLKKQCLLQEKQVLNASTCKCRKVCMHTEIEKENKTASPEDSTVKLIISLFLLGLENALKTRKQNNQTNKKNLKNIQTQQK